MILAARVPDLDYTVAVRPVPINWRSCEASSRESENGRVSAGIDVLDHMSVAAWNAVTDPEFDARIVGTVYGEEELAGGTGQVGGI